MVDEADALLKIHTESKEIILDPVMVLSKKCSTTTKTDYSVDQPLTSSILSDSVNGIPSYSVQGELDSILENQPTSTPVIGIVSLVASSMVEIPLTSIPTFLKFPRPITIISSIPTVSTLISCIPYNIMSTRVQPKIELQLSTINVHNILISSTFIYGQHKLPKIEHLRYSMKTCYTGNHQSYSIDVMKVTCGTQVTQSLNMKCIENQIS